MYLGLDAGTSEIKGVVIDENGSLLASAGEPLTVQRPHPHWSEQDPAQWWQATQQVISRLRNKIGDRWSLIKSMGLSGQMHGAVLLNRDGKVLRPAILWNDTRSAEECRLLTEQAQELHDIAGNLAMPGFTSPQLLRVARNEPEIFEQIDTVLVP